MKSKIESRIIELESKIQILERENEALSAKAEENLLLNRAFEEINSFDVENLLINTLESISVLLDVQFAGIFELVDDQFVCVSSYAQFMNEDSILINLSVSDLWLNKLKLKEICYEDNPSEFIFKCQNSGFVAHKIVIISFVSEIMKNRYFVFINDFENTDLSERIVIFNKIIQIISVKLDRYYYQNELKILNSELERKVEDRTSELVRQNNEFLALNEEYKKINEELLVAKDHAEESDRLKTAFLQNLSHEIRTPMNAIMGFSGLLVDNYNDKNKLEKFSQIINNRCNDLLDIINDILDISKIESGQVDIINEKIDLNEVFSELSIFFNEYQKRIGKQNIYFIIKPFTGIKNSVFITDKGKLKQIFINLISNAFKFTENGSIECGCEFDNNNLIFYVEDSGIGISLDKQNLIFERFYQVHHPSIKNIGGTGLGLSIVKGIVNLLKGKMWLKSEPGTGSRFSFLLPLVTAELIKSEPNVDLQNGAK